MRFIVLRDCNIGSASIKHIASHCDSIEYLDLSRTAIDDSALVLMSGVDVTTLSLDYTSITDKGMQGLVSSGQSNLKSIRVDGTSITDAGLEVLLNGCPLLERLSVRGCKDITLSSLSVFENHKRLRRVQFAGSGVDYATVDDFCRERPMLSTDPILGESEKPTDSFLDAWHEHGGLLLLSRPESGSSSLGGGIF